MLSVALEVLAVPERSPQGFLHSAQAESKTLVPEPPQVAVGAVAIALAVPVAAVPELALVGAEELVRVPQGRTAGSVAASPVDSVVAHTEAVEASLNSPTAGSTPADPFVGAVVPAEAAGTAGWGVAASAAEPVAAASADEVAAAPAAAGAVGPADRAAVEPAGPSADLHFRGRGLEGRQPKTAHSVRRPAAPAEDIAEPAEPRRLPVLE